MVTIIISRCLIKLEPDIFPLNKEASHYPYLENCVFMPSWRIRDSANPPTRSIMLTLESSDKLRRPFRCSFMVSRTGSNSFSITLGLKHRYSSLSIFTSPDLKRFKEEERKSLMEEMKLAGSRILVSFLSRARVPLFFTSKSFINFSQSPGNCTR